MSIPNIRVEWFGTFMVIQPLLQVEMPSQLLEALGRHGLSGGRQDYYSITPIDSCFLIRSRPGAINHGPHAGNLIYDFNQAGAVYLFGIDSKEVFECVLAEWYLGFIRTPHYRCYIGDAYLMGTGGESMNHFKDGRVPRETADMIIRRELKQKHLLDLEFKINHQAKTISIGKQEKK